MQIDGVNPGNGHAYGLQKVHPPDQQAEEAGEQAPAEASGAESSQTEAEKGVIRLLQEGHFKGVSDVRLRINFFDELTALKTAQVEAVAEEKVDGVVESVGPVVESFVADNVLTQEQISSVQALQEQFVQAAKQSQDDPATKLSSAFEAFVDGLQNLSSSAGDGLDWQGFIADLQSAFWAGMEELTNGLSEVKILPELSEPSGNGAAYEKFVAIYNEMRGVEPEE